VAWSSITTMLHLLISDEMPGPFLQDGPFPGQQRFLPRLALAPRYAPISVPPFQHRLLLLLGHVPGHLVGLDPGLHLFFSIRLNARY